MTRVSGEIRWGATVDEVTDADERERDWLVEMESEPLGSILDTTLSRFATDAERLTPNSAATCSITLGRLRVTLKITASTPHEAANAGENVFHRALETAVWPRSSFAKLIDYSVSVNPMDEHAYAA
jgi:hypothetical protein